MRKDLEEADRKQKEDIKALEDKRIELDKLIQSEQLKLNQIKALGAAEALKLEQLKHKSIEEEKNIEAKKKVQEELKQKQELQDKINKKKNMMSNFNEVQSRLNFVLESFADMGNEAADYKLSKEDPTNDLYVEPPLGIFEISKNFFNAIEIFNSEFTTFLSKNGLDKKENAAEIYTKVATKALGLSNLSTEKSETFVEIDTNLQSILETNKFVNEITIKKRK